MKKNLLFILLFACGFTFAQVGTNGDPDNPVSAYTDLEGFNQSDLGSQFIINNNDRPDVVLQSNNSRMALTTFSNRADFIAEACDLVDEDFEGSTCGFVCGCGGSIAGCYPGGALMPGFDITASFGAGTVVLTNGALGSNGSTIVGANTFAANTVIDFDPPVGSAGFDIAGTFFGSGNYNVAVSGAGGLIGNASVSTNQFVGVISDDEEITQIEISTNSGWTGDLIDDLSFGLPCASGEEHCDPSDCLIVACPDDVTVDCIENYIADAENAIAVFNCTGDQGGGMSETFDFTGQVQTWTVPAGINVITINAFGAQGGSNAAGTSGADGGDASGTLIVTPGEVLQIYVGGMGSLTGGYNGGGNGGTTNCGNSVGGGGGGASDVRQGGNGLGNRVIVAAGGGGAGGQRNVGCGPGSGGAGGGGYYGGGGGGGYQGNPGQGGTQIGGGAGGTGNFGGGTGGTGTSGNGGNGGTAPTNNQGGTNPGPSGGGGGGLTGLAGGSGNPGWRGGGGGGGSSYVDGVIGGTTNSGVNTGDGMIEIVYGAGGGGACTETFRYFDTQPHQTGASNCPGTTYEIVYHVGDNCGNVGCCVQIVTIDNPPPTLTVTPGEVVSCYDDITVITGPLTSNDGIAFGDATVSTSCGEPFDLKILPPVVEGVHECPGTTYTYTYRLRDNCGREVTADRVFTIGSNDSPTIVSPPDITVPCGFNAELNPDYAEVTTGCTLGYTTVVTGPVISGVENCPGSTYTYTYTVTDDCGRSASDTRTFTIVNGPPVFLNCPSVPLQLNCEDEGWELVIQAWLASIEAESDCSAPLTVTNNYNPNTQGLCISNGTKTVRWFATDNCGRTSMCEGMVIIADTEPPLFVEAPQDELVVCNFITQDKLDAWVDANGYAEVFDCWDDNTISWTTSPNNPTINCAGNPGPTSITVEFIARDGCGNKSSMEATFTALPAIPSVGGSNEGAEGVEQLQLFQNQPNPFSDETSISFFLPEGGKATLSIFDVSGKLLQEIKGDYKQGMNVEEINSSDLQPGMLYYQISTATETATRRMILLD